MADRLSDPFVPAVPVPAVLLDRWMPHLSDTELRVLLVVVRSTLGWQGTGPGGRKARDWITRSQMRSRTGRESAALSRAVDSLVRKGLVDTLDDRGRPLSNPFERRRHGGRVYYRLSTRALRIR